MEKQNVFERIYHDKLERFYVRAQQKYQALFNSPGNKRLQEQVAQEVDLKREAEECQDLLKDGRYPGQQKYLNHVVSEMNRLLIEINSTDHSREAMILDSARLSYALKVIKQLQDRPLDIIDTLHRLEEEIKKKQEVRGYA